MVVGDTNSWSPRFKAGDEGRPASATLRDWSPAMKTACDWITDWSHLLVQGIPQTAARSTLVAFLRQPAGFVALAARHPQLQLAWPDRYPVCEPVRSPRPAPTVSVISASRTSCRDSFSRPLNSSRSSPIKASIRDPP